MSTLTPEKATERLTDFTRGIGIDYDNIRTAAGIVLATLSTERQAREAAQFLLADRSTEVDWERSARQAAEKEVERKEKALALAGQTLMKLDATNNTLGDRALNAEAKLAALVAAAQVVSSATRQTPSGQWVITGDAEVLSCNLADALSALPPPVVAERTDLVTVVENLGVPEWRVQIGDVLLCYGESRADAVKIGERIEVAIRNRLAAPTQAPQDVAPIPMLLFCPNCGVQHVDAADERTPGWTNPPHRSHLCGSCGCIWRPADVPTEGVLVIQTHGRADTWMQYQDVVPVPRPQDVAGEPRPCGFGPFSTKAEAVEAWNRWSSQAQDVAGLVERLANVNRKASDRQTFVMGGALVMGAIVREAIAIAEQAISALRASPISHETKVEADAYLRALLDYTGGFYSAAIAHGMKAGPAADAVQHVERAALNLHRLAALQFRQEGK